jgi:hypothetical protein
MLGLAKQLLLESLLGGGQQCVSHEMAAEVTAERQASQTV